jgi:hypothetical protein
MVNGLSISPPAPASCFRVYPLPQVEYLVPPSAARSGPASADRRTKYELDLWHLHGACHNPFKFGRLTLGIAEPFASLSGRAIPRTRAISTMKWSESPRPPASEDIPAGKRTMPL